MSRIRRKSRELALLIRPGRPARLAERREDIVDLLERGMGIAPLPA